MTWLLLPQSLKAQQLYFASASVGMKRGSCLQVRAVADARVRQEQYTGGLVHHIGTPINWRLYRGLTVTRDFCV